MVGSQAGYPVKRGVPTPLHLTLVRERFQLTPQASSRVCHVRSDRSRSDGVLDESRYSDVLSECRDLPMWSRQLGATRRTLVSATIAVARHWPDRDARTAFLDQLWQAAVELVNRPHHPEGTATPQGYEAADARLLLLLTAALSEYVAS